MSTPVSSPTTLDSVCCVCPSHSCSRSNKLTGLPTSALSSSFVSEWSCDCHRLGRLHQQVSLALPQSPRVKTGCTSSRFSSSCKALLQPRPVAALGKTVRDALQARQAAAKIAEQTPQHPVTAIANAAWAGHPSLTGGNSLVAMAPDVVSTQQPASLPATRCLAP